MRIPDVLDAELRAGLPRLRGLTAVADVPLRQPVLDEVLRLAPGLPADLRVEIGGEGQLRVRSGLFHAHVRLAPALTLSPRPRLTLELASQLVAWGLRAVPLPPFVEVTGRLVHVDLTGVPALRPLAQVWPHVEQVTLRSVPGRLDIRLTVRVT